MPSLQQPVVVFKDFLPESPQLFSMQSSSASNLRQSYLSKYRHLNHHHSILYNTYDSMIDFLYARHEACTQRTACIIAKVLGSTGTAQQAAAAFSSCRFVESARDVRSRKMAYTGPIVIVPEAAVRNKGLPGFVWIAPAVDIAQARLRSKLYGTDVASYEEDLIEDHIQMYRKAIAAQKALIPHLVDFLSLNKTLDRLTKCLTNLKVPKQTIKAIAAKVSGLDCLWKDSIPADWLSTPPVPLPKPNKDCIIEEVSSSRYMGAQDDADCYMTIQTWPLSSQKQQEQQSCAIVSYNAEYAADSTHTTMSSASQNQGPSKSLAMRVLKGVSAAAVAVAGLVAGRNDSAVASGYKAWLNQGQQ